MKWVDCHISVLHHYYLEFERRCVRFVWNYVETWPAEMHHILNNLEVALKNATQNQNYMVSSYNKKRAQLTWPVCWENKIPMVLDFFVAYFSGLTIFPDFWTIGLLQIWTCQNHIPMAVAVVYNIRGLSAIKYIYVREDRTTTLAFMMRSYFARMISDMF